MNKEIVIKNIKNGYIIKFDNDELYIKDNIELLYIIGNFFEIKDIKIIDDLDKNNSYQL